MTTDGTNTDQTNTDTTEEAFGPIPYSRFQKVNSRLREAIKELDDLKAKAAAPATPASDAATNAANTPKTEGDSGDEGTGTGGDQGNDSGTDPVAKELAELRDKLAAAEARANAVEKRQLQRDAAEACGLPPELASRLQGDTLEAMVADGEALRAGLPRPQAPKVNGDTPGIPRDRVGSDWVSRIKDPAYYDAHREEIHRELRAGKGGDGLGSLQPNGYNEHVGTFRK